MKEVIENIDLPAALALLTGLLSAIISFYIFNKKKEADKHLASLLGADIKFKTMYLEKIDNIKHLNDNTISELSNKININSDFDLKSLEIKKHLLEKELELLKLEIIRERIFELTKSLNGNDKKEILNAVNQRTIVGQMNYINNILKQSGSTENIQYNSEN